MRSPDKLIPSIPSKAETIFFGLLRFCCPSAGAGPDARHLPPSLLDRSPGPCRRPHGALRRRPGTRLSPGSGADRRSPHPPAPCGSPALSRPSPGPPPPPGRPPAPHRRRPRGRWPPPGGCPITSLTGSAALRHLRALSWESTTCRIYEIRHRTIKKKRLTTNAQWHNFTTFPGWPMARGG